MLSIPFTWIAPLGQLALQPLIRLSSTESFSGYMTLKDAEVERGEAGVHPSACGVAFDANSAGGLKLTLDIQNFPRYQNRHQELVLCYYLRGYRSPLTFRLEADSAM